MKCEFCNAETETRRVRKHHWVRGKLYIVENVEAEQCAECGERYYHAATLDRVDRMIAADHPIKEILSVEVISV